MLPRVILHNAVSLDGRIDGFEPDVGRFYELAGAFDEDATLAGSETILRSPSGAEHDRPDDPIPPPAGAGDERPLLVVVDSRGRVRCWGALRAAGLWRGCIAAVSEATPRAYVDFLRARAVDTILAGELRVDLRAMLHELAERHGVRTVRVDSGGALNAALLSAGLVDEVSLLVHPVLAGDRTPRSFYRTDGERPVALRLRSAQTQADGALWLRYEVARPAQEKSAEIGSTIGATP